MQNIRLFTVKISRYFIVTLMTGLFFFSNAHAGDREQGYTLTIAKAIAYADQYQGDVWPGFHISVTPSIIYFADTEHTYAFNFMPKNPLWQKLIINNQPVYYMDHDAFNLKDIVFAYGVIIDDQPSYVMQFPETKNILADVNTFTHERFHFYADKESKFPKLSLADYDGFNQLMSVKLAFLEIKALTRYLLTYNESIAEESLKDAVAIHQYRTTLLNKQSLSYEQSMEVLEGVTNYVSLKSMNLSNAAYVQQVLQTKLPDCYYYTCMVSEIERWVDWDRFYFTGPAFGRAMDHKMSSASWKEEAETQAKSIEMMLQDYYRLSTEEVDQRVQNAMKNPDYRFDRIDQSLDKVLQPYLQKMEIQQENYKNQPGIELQADLIPNLDTSASQFDQRYTISTLVSLVRNISGDFVTENSIEEIHLKNIPLLYDTDPMVTNPPDEQSPDKVWIKFKVLPDTKLFIDGKEDSVGNYVNSSKRLSFHQLLIESSQATIKINKDGLLDGTEGMLRLQLPQQIKQKSVHLNRIYK